MAEIKPFGPQGQKPEPIQILSADVMQPETSTDYHIYNAEVKRVVAIAVGAWFPRCDEGELHIYIRTVPGRTQIEARIQPPWEAGR